MKNKYPRPQAIRKEWKNLNGTWNFEFDKENIGYCKEWFKEKSFSKKINVPFAFQSKLSGINIQEPCDNVWYQRKFKISKDWNELVYIHFGAVDYESKVYINGNLVGHHIGGSDSFSYEISKYLTYEEEDIVIWVSDPTFEERIPRGKQSWTKDHHSIWYPRTTGIWQTVWLEPVSKHYIKKILMTPDIDDGSIQVHIETETSNNKTLILSIYDGEEVIVKDEYQFKNILNRKIQIWNNEIFKTNLHNYGKTWSPENPFLYDVKIEVKLNDEIVDSLDTYFGMRKLHAENGMFYLNNRPYYLKLVLDQGYFKDGLLTAPSDDDLINDINLSKEMGFNGCRKHQKVDEERFYYHADKLGFLVWGEMPSTAIYDAGYSGQIINEWTNIVMRDYNHPSIMTWVVLNESWGVPSIDYNKQQQNYAMSLYHLTKALDATRLVVSNDGWEQVKTDISAIHNYGHGVINDPSAHVKFEKSISTLDHVLSHFPANRNIYAKGYQYEGEPIMLTEFGGISFAVEEKNGWGYSYVKDAESYIKEYERIIDAIAKSEVLSGYCYTQLTDVEQEINGLLTYTRKPKVILETIKSINDKVSFKIPIKK